MAFTGMEFRRDLVPALLAFVLSLALHAVLFGIDPSRFAQDPSAEIETVVVEYLPDAQPETQELPPTEPARVAEKPPPKRQPNPPKQPKPAPPEKPKPASKAGAEPLPQPSPASPPAQHRAQDQSPAKAAAPVAPPPLTVRTRKPEERVIDPTRSVPRLEDLMPRPMELTSRPGRRQLPDPAGGETLEATLGLGETDVRYRGYLDRVEAAIDRSWSRHWKEALLAAGRAGSVLVRFTITPAGDLGEVRVEESSGSTILDEEASTSVRLATLPPFPSHWTIERLHLLAQFDYRFE
jgi:TonB family protein